MNELDRPPPRLRAKAKNGSHDSAAARRQRPDLNASAWRAARGRSARGFGQKRTGFEMCTAERAGAPGGRAAQPRWRRRPRPPYTAARPPRNRAHAKHTPRQHTPRLRNSELAPAGRRGARAVASRNHGPRRAPHEHRSQRIAHTRPPHARDSESKPHRPASLQRDQSRVSEDDDDIHVIKRNGKKEVVRYDKITSRIKKLCYGLDSKYIKPNVRARRPVVWRRLHAVDATRLRE